MNFLKRLKFGLSLITSKDKYDNLNRLLNSHYENGFNHGFAQCKSDVNKELLRVFSDMGQPLSDDFSLDELFINLSIICDYKKIKLSKGNNINESYVIKLKQLLSKQANNIVSIFSDYTPATIKRVEAGVYNCLTNYFLLICNKTKDVDYALIDNSYLNLLLNRNGSLSQLISDKKLIVPSKVVDEYYAITKGASGGVKGVIKKDLIKLLTSPSNVIIPTSNHCANLSPEVIKRFTYESGALHEADLQIYNFYQQFGRQFKKLYFLCTDMDLCDSLKELDYGSVNHKLVIISEPLKIN